MSKLHYHPYYTRATIYVTMKCNLHCPDCLQRGLPIRKDFTDLTLDDLGATLDILAREGLKFHCLTLQGGEPALWPHLAAGVGMVKKSGVADQVQIITNGTVDELGVYGAADVVRITDYGAINRFHIHRLRKELGKRAHVCTNVHIPMPLPFSPTVACALPQVAISKGKLHLCCFQAAVETNYRGLHKPGLRRYLDENKPQGARGCCWTCIANKDAYRKLAVPPTVQFCVWGVEEISWIHSLKRRPKWLYKLYARFRKMRGR